MTLRVVFLGHTAELSGAELGIAELLPALDDVDPHVILAADGPLVGRLRSAGVSVEVLPLRARARSVKRAQFAGSPLRMLPAALAAGGYAFRLARRLRRLRPDLLHAYTLKSLVYGGAAAKLSRTPLVWQVNDRISADYLPPLAVRGIRALARRTASGVIAISAATLDSLGELDVPVTIVHHAIALEPTAHPATAGRPFTAGVLGRLAPWKGQTVFLEAFARAFPEGAERAVVIGAALFGENEYAQSLEALPRRLGIESRVEFRGFCEDVSGELARLDALVHASVLPEPFGRVVVEGMAAGLPVVASAAGGPGEIIEDGVDGLLYPAGDVAALASALQRLAADSGLRARLGEAAAGSAERYRPEHAAARTTAFYREVLLRPSQGTNGAAVPTDPARES